MSVTGLAAERAPGGLHAGQRLRTIVVMALTAALIAAAAWYIEQSSDVTTVDIAAGPGPAPQVGGLPPAFDALDVDGEAFSMAALAGQPVWLTFGASWCGDCRAESPDLQATYGRHAAAGLAMVGVFIDESDAAVREYATRLGFTFRMVADPRDRIASAYHLLGIPTHYFIGRDGRIREIRIGALSPDEMDRLVRDILG